MKGIINELIINVDDDSNKQRKFQIIDSNELQ
jgi:hypothetical protein